MLSCSPFMLSCMNIKHLIMNYNGSCRETSDIPMMVKDRLLNTVGKVFGLIVVIEGEGWKVREERKRWLEDIRMVSRALDRSLFLQPISPRLFGGKGSVQQLALPPPSFTSPCTSSNYSLPLPATAGKGNDKEKGSARIQRPLKQGLLLLRATSAAKKGLNTLSQQQQRLSSLHKQQIHVSSETVK